MIMKSLYLLPVPQFDAIIGMPFFRQNEIDLAGLEFGNIEVNGSKVSISKGDMDMDMDTDESPGNMEIIGMISRKRFKKKLKRDEIEELYLATIREAKMLRTTLWEQHLSINNSKTRRNPRMNSKGLWDNTQRRIIPTDASRYDQWIMRFH